MADATPKTSDFQGFLETLTSRQAATPPSPAMAASIRQVSNGLNMALNGLKGATGETKAWFDEFVREQSEAMAPLLSQKVKQATDLATAAEKGVLDPLLSRIADSTKAALGPDLEALHAKIDAAVAAFNAPPAETGGKTK